MIPTIGLIVAGYVVLRCFEIWTVNPDHWLSPRMGAFMKIWAGITCLGTIILAASLYNVTEARIIPIRTFLNSPVTLDAVSGAGILGLVAYGWTKTRRLRSRKLIARIHAQSVIDGIDLSRSLM